MVHADLEVTGADGRSATARFLVDSGAFYSVLPEVVWRAIGLEPTRDLDFVLADGTSIARKISECRFAFQGIEATSPVVLGEGEDVALLGSVTLETLGLVLNPLRRTLTPMRMRLASRAASSSRTTLCDHAPRAN
jgi:predicted aspartyl protease